ncbi:hypothetical protein FVE85_1622 [Porphyridium purpureum]|uniref:BHLH domain-containing protein n=1 Tax=Porphyridium purpureum TaxID=35688 RepID=A0A5J4YYB9_PORPP|nr:hypothetical protein FVE85_1622 [Porphyridium purpureum]|eukprot:POR0825..scf209_3
MHESGCWSIYRIVYTQRPCAHRRRDSVCSLEKARKGNSVFLYQVGCEGVARNVPAMDMITWDDAYGHGEELNLLGVIDAPIDAPLESFHDAAQHGGTGAPPFAEPSAEDECLFLHGHISESGDPLEDRSDSFVTLGTDGTDDTNMHRTTLNELKTVFKDDSQAAVRGKRHHKAQRPVGAISKRAGPQRKQKRAALSDDSVGVLGLGKTTATASLRTPDSGDGPDTDTDATRKKTRSSYSRRCREKLNDLLTELYSKLPPPSDDRRIKHKHEILLYAIEVLERVSQDGPSISNVTSSRGAGFHRTVAHSMSSGN